MTRKFNRSGADKPRMDDYETITARLIAAIESDTGEFTMPWRRAAGSLSLPANALTKKTYSGINIVALWVAAEARGFTSPLWGTYRQWKEIGAQVIEGAKGEPIIFYKTFQAEPNPEDDRDDGTRRTARSYTVFNAAQVEGFHQEKSEGKSEPPFARIEAAERFIQATGARVLYGGDRAYYARQTDHIQMPDDALFTGTATISREESQAATLLHELSHWSGAPHRLNREFGKRYGDEAYAFEELVAEIGSCMLMAELSISAVMRPDHAQYIKSWISILRDDKRAIFSAAARAAEAATYLKSFQTSTPAKPQTLAEAGTAH
jgi:antirestriction protein ArdC